jgi:hypothetical protein
MPSIPAHGSPMKTVNLGLSIVNAAVGNEAGQKITTSFPCGGWKNGRRLDEVGSGVEGGESHSRASDAKNRQPIGGEQRDQQTETPQKHMQGKPMTARINCFALGAGARSSQGAVQHKQNPFMSPCTKIGRTRVQ